VAGDDHGDAVGGEGGEGGGQRLGVPGGDAAIGLVGEEAARAAHEHRRHLGAAQLPARELMRVLVEVRARLTRLRHYVTV
jgi:hypothetical protein